MVVDTALILGLLNTIGLILIAYINQVNQKKSPAQKESEIIKNYGDLIEQYRRKITELLNEIDRVTKERDEDAAAHEIEMNNTAAVIEKRRIEYEQELAHLRNELQAWQIGWSKLRRFAVKYVPKDVALPEIDGVTTVDLK